VGWLHQGKEAPKQQGRKNLSGRSGFHLLLSAMHSFLAFTWYDLLLIS
jgi:hypothetical protein